MLSYFDYCYFFFFSLFYFTTKFCFLYVIVLLDGPQTLECRYWIMTRDENTMVCYQTVSGSLHINIVDSVKSTPTITGRYNVSSYAYTAFLRMLFIFS
jgi:hypothetical protein